MVESVVVMVVIVVIIVFVIMAGDAGGDSGHGSGYEWMMLGMVVVVVHDTKQTDNDIFPSLSQQISIGIQANLIVFPVSLLVVQFFRKSRPRNMRQSRIKLAALANKTKRKLRRKPRKTAPTNYSKLEDFVSERSSY